MIPTGMPTPAPIAAACELEPEDVADVVAAAGAVVVALAGEVEEMLDKGEVEEEDEEVDVLL